MDIGALGASSQDSPQSSLCSPLGLREAWRPLISLEIKFKTEKHEKRKSTRSSSQMKYLFEGKLYPKPIGTDYILP